MDNWEELICELDSEVIETVRNLTPAHFGMNFELRFKHQGNE